MSARRRWSVAVVCAAAVAVPCAGVAQTAASLDAKVQVPELSAPQRASLAGQLASVAFGPGDLTRGTFALPAPFSAPSERGALLASPFPTYAPEAGISEWGAGWTGGLAIVRFRVDGDLDYATDDRTGPYGRMVKGPDGAWYPAGLSSAVRVVEAGDVLTAYLPDGTVATYGGAARVSTARGTYAWLLTEVRTVTNRKARVDWIANASGRRFVSSVSYGGVGEDHQYRIELEYHPLAQSFEDYRSGQLLALDRRVKKVTVLAKHAVTGAFEERWHHELGYAEEGFGPGYYLASVQQVFRSGARPPPATYGYALGKDHLAAAQLEAAPWVAPILQASQSDLLQPNRSTALDTDDDGRADLEWAYDNRLWRQTDSGFVAEALPPAADAYVYCRRPTPSIYASPRTIARLRSGAGDETPYVLDLRSDAYGQTSYLTACNRLGQRIGSTTMAGSWTLGATVRLVDLNRDHKPDLVRLQAGQVRILPNTSTASAFAFGPVRTATLTPSLNVDTAWVNDFNGDGIADLIGRVGGTVVVWAGKGSFEFESQGRTFGLVQANGTPIANLSGFGLTFVDANKDGLADVVLSGSTGNVTRLYMNRGTRFVETAVPGLAAVDASTSTPVAMDARGTGNTELTFTKAGQGWAVALDAAGTGLMSWADDGKGSRLLFHYARSPAVPGARSRQAVVARVTSRSSGVDDLASDYAYAGPVEHRAGKFLVGYARVTRTGPLVTETADFLHGDEFAGVLEGTTTRDALAPGIEAFETRSYTDAALPVPWKRPARTVTGYRTTGVPVAEVSATTTSYLAYWQDQVCPSSIQRQGASGTLTTTTAYETVPTSFGSALACLPQSIVEEGVHSDVTLHFRHRTEIGRNAVGLVTSVTSVAPEGAWRIQDVTYTPDWRIETIGAPGQGVTRVAWAPGTGLAQTLTFPDGVIAGAVERDPVTDFISRLRTGRGMLVHDQYFHPDAQERLKDRWDSIGGGTALNPDVRLTYAYATATTPASIRASVLLDPALPIVREDVELLTAKGEPLGKATRVGEGWALGRLTWRTPATGWTQSLARGPLAATQDPSATEYAQLFAGAALVESSQQGPLGTTANAQTRFHADVERNTTETLSVSASRLVRTTRENGLFPATTETDPAGNVLARTDEAGTRWEFVRDALGRLREVRLPGGTGGHRALLDGHGRVRRVERDGIAAVEYLYDATTGQLRQKRFLGAAGVPRRTVELARDGAGRVTTETHRDATTGAVKTFRWYWDGATPEAPAATGRAGLLTAVTGDGYVKRFTDFRADGKLVTSVVELPGFRKVTTTIGYNELGDPRTRTIEVFAGPVRVASGTRAETYDQFGRADGIAPFATFDFDLEGLLASASFANGDRLDLVRDGLTRAVVGSTQTTAAFVASTSTRMSPRGLVDWERYRVGATSRLRSFGYTDQRFMETALDEAGSFAYAYDPSGLPTSIAEGGASTSIIRGGSTLTAWNVVRRLDDLGRTIQRGDLALAYGPDGQLQTAQRGARTWTFVHDEGGHRLAKLEGGAVTEAYVEDAYLDASQLVEPVRIGGRLAGVLRNGTFQPLAADARGTVMGEANGTPLIASPIGRRGVRPALSKAIDFVEKGYDADLGTVRMGVRDYDPDVYAFTTPDPLFLEEPALCTQRLVECSLYAYANDAPMLYVDPSGKIVWLAVVGVAWAVYEVASSIADVYSAVQTVRDPNATTREKVVSVGLAAVSVAGPGGGYSTAHRVGTGILKEGIEQAGEAEARRRLRQWVLNEGVAGGRSGGGDRGGNPRYGPYDKEHFRENLAARTRANPADGDAHHVFPQKFADEFAALEDGGINVHDPKYGAWFQKDAHRTLSKEIEDEWDTFFLEHENPTRAQVLQFARKQAADYGFQLGF